MWEVLLCDCSVFFLPLDMIPENALEEMTKNMDPNLVIVEAKDGVQMKYDVILDTSSYRQILWTKWHVYIYSYFVL